jgi:peptide/nickel transport system substrate-binding protein
MQRAWNRIVLWSVLALLSVGAWSCRPEEVVVEKPVTRVATKLAVDTVVVTVEKTVIVTQQETVQVVVTSTPTPIPEGGFVTRTTYADAETLNPVLAADEGSRAFCELMFEGLLRIEPFSGELEPNFAEGWRVSDDGLTYTFTIRKGLEWSDGQQITAHDFYFTYAALLSGKLDTRNAERVSNIQEIEVLDDHTVAVTFAQADCSNLDSLQLGWLPMHVFTDDVDAYDFSELAIHEFNSTPNVSSGPFMLREWVRGDHWTQVRNDNYWRGAPHLEGIITRVVSGQATMLDMLRNGEVDLGVGFDARYLVEVELEPDLQIFRFLSDSYDFIGFQMGDPDDPQPRLNEDGTLNEDHGEHPILADKRVRQAIVHALDRKELIARARLGQGIPLHANVLPTVSWAYNVDLEPRDFSRRRANQLLEGAGWAMNEATAIRERNGVSLKLSLYTNAGNQVRETMGALIQEQLREVGVEIELIPVEWYSFLDVLFGQTFDLVLVSWANLGVNPDDGDLWSAGSDALFEGGNFVSYYNPEVEKKLTEARGLPGCDQDARAELYRAIQARLYEDQPYAWLDVPRDLVAIHKRVGGVNPGPQGVWHNVHEWYIQE